MLSWIIRRLLPQVFVIFVLLMAQGTLANSLPSSVNQNNALEILEQLIEEWILVGKADHLMIEANSDDGFTSLYPTIHYLRNLKINQLRILLNELEKQYQGEDLNTPFKTSYAQNVRKVIELAFFLQVRARDIKIDRVGFCLGISNESRQSFEGPTAENYQEFLDRSEFAGTYADLHYKFHDDLVNRMTNPPLRTRRVRRKWVLPDSDFFASNKIENYNDDRLRIEERDFLARAPYQSYRMETPNSLGYLYHIDPVEFVPIHIPTTGQWIYSFKSSPHFMSPLRLDVDGSVNNITDPSYNYDSRVASEARSLIEELHLQVQQANSGSELLKLLRPESKAKRRLAELIGLQLANYIYWNLSRSKNFSLKGLLSIAGLLNAEEGYPIVLHRFGFIPLHGPQHRKENLHLSVYGDVQSVQGQSISGVLDRNLRLYEVYEDQKNHAAQLAIALSKHAGKAREFIYEVYARLLDKDRDAFTPEYLQELIAVDEGLEATRLFFFIFENYSTTEVEAAFTIYDSLKYPFEETRPLLPSERVLGKKVYPEEEELIEIIRLGKDSAKFSFKRILEAATVHLAQAGNQNVRVVAHADSNNFQNYLSLGFEIDFSPANPELNGFGDHYLLSAPAEKLIKAYQSKENPMVLRFPNPIERSIFRMDNVEPGSDCELLLITTESEEGPTRTMIRFGR